VALLSLVLPVVMDAPMVFTDGEGSRWDELARWTEALMQAVSGDLKVCVASTISVVHSDSDLILGIWDASFHCCCYSINRRPEIEDGIEPDVYFISCP
jgi:hypothetical protein